MRAKGWWIATFRVNAPPLSSSSSTDHAAHSLGTIMARCALTSDTFLQFHGGFTGFIFWAGHKWQRKNAAFGQFLDPYRHGMTANTLKSTWNFVPIFRWPTKVWYFSPTHPPSSFCTLLANGCRLSGRAAAQSTFTEPYFGAQFDCHSVDVLPPSDQFSSFFCFSVLFGHRYYRCL